jgi:membrane protein DedA with SNARE-associated domain/rhodanese-related sulfurtransferase
MQALVALIEQYGLLLVFANVLLLQLGVPLPAYPVLITVGALAADGRYAPAQVVLVAVAASVIADLAWYAAGVRAGRRVLGTMCRLSLSPEHCVRRSESIYERFGPPSLMVARFVPGFAAIATAMAGIVRTRLPVFLLFEAIGAALWSGVGVALGWVFRDAVNEVIATLEDAGRWGLLLVASALVLFIAVKAWQRFVFRRQLRMPRVTIDELKTMMRGRTPPLLLDVRLASSHAEARIPGARWLDSKAVKQSLAALPPADEVVVYCACPQDASAVLVSKQLLDLGFTRVRALRGGIDAWVAAGEALEGPAANSAGR